MKINKANKKQYLCPTSDFTSFYQETIMYGFSGKGTGGEKDGDSIGGWTDPDSDSDGDDWGDWTPGKPVV